MGWGVAYFSPHYELKRARRVNLVYVCANGCLAKAPVWDGRCDARASKRALSGNVPCALQVDWTRLFVQVSLKRPWCAAGLELTNVQEEYPGTQDAPQYVLPPDAQVQANASHSGEAADGEGLAAIDPEALPPTIADQVEKVGGCQMS